MHRLVTLGFEGALEERVLCNTEIEREEVVKALGKIKNGKAFGIDDITSEMLKEGEKGLWTKCGNYVLELSVREKYQMIGKGLLSFPCIKVKEIKGNARTREA